MQLSEEISCLMPNTKGHRRKESGEKPLLFHKMMLWIVFSFVLKDASFGFTLCSLKRVTVSLMRRISLEIRSFNMELSNTGTFNLIPSQR